MKYKLSVLADILSAEHLGSDVSVSGLQIDSRKVKKGDCFVALKGEKFDGHDFINAVMNKGVIAIITEKKIATDIPQLIVNDTTQALGKVANHHRLQFNIPMIGLTGSCGKTTTKAFIASILRQRYQTLSPEVSMNNHIGVPLTLLQLASEDKIAVIEMGTNHFGEIKYLSDIARPTVAMLLNIKSVHLEFLKDLDGVAKEKSDIFKGLTKNGIAILNKDDVYYDYLAKQIPSETQILTFGCETPADVMAKNIKLKSDGKATFDLQVLDKIIHIKLPILGEHNVMNALAASAAALAVKVDVDDIKAGLEAAMPVTRRLQEFSGLNQARVIDDSYSANPDAVKAALAILANAKGKLIFAFGGMGELDPSSAIEIHSEVGTIAKSLGIDYFFADGELCQHSVEAFGNNGFHFKTRAEFIRIIKQYVDKDTTVLVKGSLSTKMNEVVRALT